MAQTTKQLDLYRHSPKAMAESYRQAAEAARKNPYFTPEDAEARARYYYREADKWAKLA